MPTRRTFLRALTTLIGGAFWGVCNRANAPRLVHKPTRIPEASAVIVRVDSQQPGSYVMRVCVDGCWHDLPVYA